MQTECLTTIRVGRRFAGLVLLLLGVFGMVFRALTDGNPLVGSTASPKIEGEGRFGQIWFFCSVATAALGFLIMARLKR